MHVVDMKKIFGSQKALRRSGVNIANTTRTRSSYRRSFLVLVHHVLSSSTTVFAGAVSELVSVLTEADEDAAQVLPNSKNGAGGLGEVKKPPGSTRFDEYLSFRKLYSSKIWADDFAHRPDKHHTGMRNPVREEAEYASLWQNPQKYLEEAHSDAATFPNSFCFPQEESAHRTFFSCCLTRLSTRDCWGRPIRFGEDLPDGGDQKNPWIPAIWKIWKRTPPKAGSHPLGEYAKRQAALRSEKAFLDFYRDYAPAVRRFVRERLVEVNLPPTLYDDDLDSEAEDLEADDLTPDQREHNKRMRSLQAALDRGEFPADDERYFYHRILTHLRRRWRTTPTKAWFSTGVAGASDRDEHESAPAGTGVQNSENDPRIQPRSEDSFQRETVRRAEVVRDNDRQVFNLERNVSTQSLPLSFSHFELPQDTHPTQINTALILLRRLAKFESLLQTSPDLCCYHTQLEEIQLVNDLVTTYRERAADGGFFQCLVVLGEIHLRSLMVSFVQRGEFLIPLLAGTSLATYGLLQDFCTAQYHTEKEYLYHVSRAMYERAVGLASTPVVSPPRRVTTGPPDNVAAAARRRKKFGIVTACTAETVEYCALTVSFWDCYGRLHAHNTEVYFETDAYDYDSHIKERVCNTNLRYELDFLTPEMLPVDFQSGSNLVPD